MTSSSLSKRKTAEPLRNVSLAFKNRNIKCVQGEEPYGVCTHLMYTHTHGRIHKALEKKGICSLQQAGHNVGKGRKPPLLWKPHLKNCILSEEEEMSVSLQSSGRWDALTLLTRCSNAAERPSCARERKLLLHIVRLQYGAYEMGHVTFVLTQHLICCAETQTHSLCGSPESLRCSPSAARCWTPLRGRSSPPRSVGTTLQETSKQQWHPNQDHTHTLNTTHIHTPVTATFLFHKWNHNHTNYIKFGHNLTSH